MKTDLNQYAVNITWSAEDECFFATVPAVPGCMSHGETIEEAGRNIREALVGVVESLEANGHPVPVPDQAAEEIRRFAPVLNISALARLSGINKHTLATKLRRGTKFTEDEAHRIRTALAR